MFQNENLQHPSLIPQILVTIPLRSQACKATHRKAQRQPAKSLWQCSECWMADILKDLTTRDQFQMHRWENKKTITDSRKSSVTYVDMIPNTHTGQKAMPHRLFNCGGGYIVSDKTRKKSWNWRQADADSKQILPEQKFRGLPLSQPAFTAKLWCGF
jgi:hypothetical protein